MTRIENENGGDIRLDGMRTEIEKLKKDLKRKQSKKIFNCGTCLMLFLLIILGLVVMVSYVLAKSGLKTLPVFTDYFYKEPQPTYLVKSTILDQTVLVNRLITAVKSESMKQKKTENFVVNLELSDEEITALLRDKTAKEQGFSERIDYWQIAVLPENLQIFFKFQKPRNLIITLNVIPEIKNGRLNLSVRRFALGQLNLPRFVGTFMIENIGENMINKYLTSLVDIGKIEEISMDNKKIKLKILINNFNNFNDAF